MAVSSGAWLGSLLAACTLFGIAAPLLHSRWAQSRQLATGWLVVTVVLVTASALALVVINGDDEQGVALLSEYAQEAPFAIDTVLAFALILRRYLPDGDHQSAALYGTVGTLVLRIAFIGSVSGLLATVTWLLYLVGVLLIYTAVAFVRGHHRRPAEPGDMPERWLTRAVIRWGRRTRRSGLTYLPPMALAVVLLTLEDPLVWPDGGPAYQTIVANILALLPVPVLVGRSEKLLTLIGYLPSGLGLVAGFLGIKIIMFALHDNIIPFLNGGEPVTAAPAIPAAVSFAFTAAVVGITVVASLLRNRTLPGSSHYGLNAAADPDGDPAPTALTDPAHAPSPAPRDSTPAAPSHLEIRPHTRSLTTAVVVAVAAGLVVVAGLLIYRRWLNQRDAADPPPTCVDDHGP